MRIICLIVFALAIVHAQSDPLNELNDRGLAAADRRDFEQAKQLFGEAIQGWQARGPKYDAHVAIVKMNLAEVYGAEGRRLESAAILEESLALFRRTLGIKDLRSLTALNILGGMYMMVGNHPRAAALYAEALPIERELYPNDLQLARTLSGMASLNMQEDRAAEGLPLAKEALALTIKAEGEESLDAALAYANVAEGYRTTGRPDRAAPLFRRSRALYERLLGPEHPRVSSVLTQEGLLLMAEGKLGTAEKTFERALSIVEKSCPGCAYERAIAENDLALLRLRQGKYTEADRLLSDVLALQEKSQGLPGAEMAVTLQSLAAVRQKERRYEDAEQLQRRAASLRSTYR